MILPFCFLGFICSAHVDLHLGKRDQHELTERDLMLDPMLGIHPLGPEKKFMFKLERKF